MAKHLPLVIFIGLATVNVITTVSATVDATEQSDATQSEKESTETKLPYDKIRLPGNIFPLKYLVYLHPNITDGKFQYTGDVKILMEIKEETDYIVLHSLRISHLVTEVFEVSPTNDDVTDAKNEKKIEVKATLKNKKREQVIVQLGSRLSTQKRYLLHIIFAAELRTELTGFYRSSYKTAQGDKRFIATTQFEATGARLAFPCFDEPAMKANFSIVIVRESIHTALSNMPVEREVHRADGLVVDYFQESVKMSTYLLAFIVSDFGSVSAPSQRGIKVSIWAPKDKVAQANYAVQVTPKILDYYETFFDVQFPLPKLDLIGIPDFGAGAMENWGLITYRLTALLYDDKESSSANKQLVAFVIAHELAHQWFGNLVTMKWWNDLWLNEGFATYVMNIGADLVGPSWKMMEQFVTSNVHSSLALDSHSQSHPISVPVKDPAEIGALFDTISYQKGSAVIRMMRDFIGHKDFLKGLSNYLKKYKYGNAASDDLWACLSEASGGMHVKHVMDTWTLQMGYPVVNVRRDGDTAYLTQERFVTDVEDKQTSSTSNLTWNIPLTFYYQHNRRKQRTWFYKSDKNVRLNHSDSLGWLKLNVDEVGFYRVNYDENNWKELATQLKTDHTVLSSTDRANLIDDAFQLANVGKIAQGQALEFTEYLKKEKDYVPYKAAISSLGYIGGMLFSRSGYAVYEKYILQQILPRVKELGWNDNGSHLDKFLRGRVLQLAVRHKNKQAVKKAKEIFNDWMVQKKSIPANLRETVYYAGIKYGTEKEWSYMFHMYLHSRYPSEKALLMHSLASTSDPNVLKKYLNMTLNNDVIRSQDSCGLIAEIALNPIGRKMAYEFMSHNWDIMLKRYGGHFRQLSRIFKATLGRGKTNGELSEATRFFATHKVGGGKLAAKQTLANIRDNIKWLADHEKAVVDWLKSKV